MNREYNWNETESLDFGHFLGHKGHWCDSRWETVGLKFSGKGKIDDAWFMNEIRLSNEQDRCTENLAQACHYILVAVFNHLKTKSPLAARSGRCPRGAEIEGVWDYCINRIVNVHKWGKCWSQGQTNPVRVVFVTVQRHVRIALWSIWYDDKNRPTRKLGQYLDTHRLGDVDNASMTYAELIARQ